MEVNHYKQREVLDVEFHIPNGGILRHPVIVISRNDVNKQDKSFIGVMMSGSTEFDDQFRFPLEDDMFDVPTTKICAVRCHLIATIEHRKVKKSIGKMKKKPFLKLLEQINKVVFSFEEP